MKNAGYGPRVPGDRSRWYWTMTVKSENGSPPAGTESNTAGNLAGNGSSPYATDASRPPWPRKNSHKLKHGYPIYGAVDLGTNNCRLLVAKPVHGGFRIIDAFSRIVRLGEGLVQSGRLCDAAMDRAVEALRVCAGKLGRRQVTRVRAVATEACRAAENSSEFVDRVRRETGIALDVITPAEEARLAVMGCWSLLEDCRGRAIVFDIGGGSTEVILTEIDGLDKPKIIDWLSIPLGVVTLSERIDGPQISQAVYREIYDEVESEVADFNARNGLANGTSGDDRDICLVGTSGTVTTLTSVHLGLKEYDRSKVDGARVNLAEIAELAHHVTFLDQAGRAAIPSIGHDRADLVVPGCAIFEAMVSSWKTETLMVADRGIREGVLRNLMRRDPLVNAPKPVNGGS